MFAKICQFVAFIGSVAVIVNVIISNWSYIKMINGNIILTSGLILIVVFSLSYLLYEYVNRKLTTIKEEREKTNKKIDDLGNTIAEFMKIQNEQFNRLLDMWNKN